MVNNQDQAQRNAEQHTYEVRQREARSPKVAAALRKWYSLGEDLCDREVIESAVPALMEDLRDRVMRQCHSADDVKVISTDTSEYRRLTITERTEYSTYAAQLLQQVKAVMDSRLPPNGELFEHEATVVRVRQKSQADGIARRPVTYVAGVFRCAAAPASVLLVRAEQSVAEGTLDAHKA